MLTTVNAALQRVPARDLIAAQSLSAAPGNAARMDDLARWLENNGYSRTSTVRETGEYAVRGGILDLFPPGLGIPVRLDFFGDTLESIRSFDPETQRTAAQLAHPRPRARQRGPAYHRDDQALPPGLSRPSSERRRGATRSTRRSPKAAAIPASSIGCRCSTPGSTRILDYLDGVPIALDALAEDAAGERLAQIKDYYDARRDALGKTGEGAPYKPLGAGQALFRTGGMAPTPRRGAAGALHALRPARRRQGGRSSIAAGGKAAASRPSAPTEDTNVFDAVVRHIRERQGDGKRVIVAGWTDGSRERLGAVLADHGLTQGRPVAIYARALALPKADVALGVLPVEAGFETRDARRRLRAGHPRRPPRAPQRQAQAGRRTSCPN